ncbi:hypothetical protein SPONN_2561 [uncultured Candidatus Thioglobus sp.]|nr:hypothetical protein SPONN_2561 [uncultured Candidatus Thioglobus sp.]SMM98913.1 hypothetical protein SPONL_238 [uncultured Candidatus Thioglobus sp.]
MALSLTFEPNNIILADFPNKAVVSAFIIFICNKLRRIATDFTIMVKEKHSINNAFSTDS